MNDADAVIGKLQWDRWVGRDEADFWFHRTEGNGLSGPWSTRGDSLRALKKYLESVRK